MCSPFVYAHFQEVKDMQKIKLRVKDRRIYLLEYAGTRPVISENKDLLLTFDFDSEWENLPKTVRIKRERSAKHYVDIPMTIDQTETTVPSQMMQSGTIIVGVYSGEMATAPFAVTITSSILDGSERPEYPDEITLKQLLEEKRALSQIIENLEIIDDLEARIAELEARLVELEAELEEAESEETTSES